MLGGEETRVTNAATGGEKGSKLARFDLIPARPLWQVAEHYGVGASKYEDRNWERGYDWSLSFAAAQRHMWEFWNGEDRDPETGTHHLAAAVFHCLAMMEYGETHPELDDRPARPAQSDADPAFDEVRPLGDYEGRRARITDEFTGSAHWIGQEGTLSRRDTYGPAPERHPLRLTVNETTHVAVHPSEVCVLD